jgi:hypothetical protein
MAQPIFQIRHLDRARQNARRAAGTRDHRDVAQVARLGAAGEHPGQQSKRPQLVVRNPLSEQFLFRDGRPFEYLVKPRHWAGELGRRRRYAPDVIRPRFASRFYLAEMRLARKESRPLEIHRRGLLPKCANSDFMCDKSMPRRHLPGKPAPSASLGFPGWCRG